MKSRLATFLRDLTVRFRPHRRPRGRRRPLNWSRYGVAAEVLEDRCLLATLTVNTLDDNTDGDVSLTLREAISLVNNGGDAMAALLRSLTAQEQAQIDTTNPFGTMDEIVFDNALAGGTITLNDGELPIREDVVITGLGADFLTIDANNSSRIFTVNDLSEFDSISVTLTGLTLTGGSVASSGGAIQNFENLTISGSVISANVATFGGGIFNVGSTNLTDTTVSQNTASADGGGIHNQQGTVTLELSMVSGNSAGSNGGGIQNGGGVVSPVTVSIANSMITGNTSSGSGGGIHNTHLAAMLDLVGTELSLNEAAMSGGGIANAGGTISLDGSTFSNNLAQQDGGGLHTSGNALISGGSFSANIANSEGGAISTEGMLSVTGTTFSANNAVFGGAISTGLVGVAAVMDSTFSMNSALFGGAIGNQGTVSASNDIFTGNSAVNLAGAIENMGGDLTVDTSHFESNSVNDNGGAIVNSGNATVLNSTFLMNSAGANGGAIDNTGVLNVSDSTLSGNTALLFGGGIATEGTLTITDSTVSGNTAGFGGGLYNAGTADITGGSLTLNEAGQDGGGIFNNDGGSMTISDSAISANTANNQGGGLFNTNGDFFDVIDVFDSTISENSAGNDGGGIYNDVGAFTETFNTVISANTAGNNGGGIYNANVDFFGGMDVFDSTISGNTAGNDGGGIYHFGDLTQVFGSTISNNFATNNGGGIYSIGSSTDVFNSTISGNSALGDGGGIHNGSGQTNIIDSTISQNSASGAGGGVHVESTGQASITNSTISGNTADGNGGGINNGGQLILTSSTIVGNRADADPLDSDGGGIFTTLGMASTILYNTIVAGNLRGTGNTLSDLANANVDSDSAFNLIGDPNSSGGLVDGMNGNIVGDGGNAIDLATVLDPTLRNNGGVTLTHALVAGSAAIDAGDNALAGSLMTDQRGDPFVRIFNGTVDIGAYEFQSIVVPDPDKLEDENDGDYSPGDLSLREAIGLANGSEGSDTIDVSELMGTITLNEGELGISDDLTIIGPGGEQLTINADGQSRIFNVDDGDGGNAIVVMISGLVLTGGGGVEAGGAILNLENLAIANSKLRGNTAEFTGGAIQNDFGTLRVTGGTLSRNSAGSSGGAIDTFAGSATISGSMLSENTADFGGAISSFSDLTITGSTLSQNSALVDGGGVNSGGNLTVSESMFSLNATESGGAIFNEGTGSIAGSSFLRNAASLSGGGIANFADAFTIENSTFSENSAGDQGGGVFNTGNLMVMGSTLSRNSALVGGALDNTEGTLTVMNSTLSENTAELIGGGIDNILGTVRVMSSMLMGNLANDSGGGIINIGGDVTLEGTMLMQNTAMSDGGGIENFGTLTIMDSTLSHNAAMGSDEGGGFGGAIDSFEGTTTITNSTISNNSARAGAGIDSNLGTLTLMDTEIFENSAMLYGGGVEVFDSTATISGGSIMNNSAGLDGGGIESFFATLILSDVFISGNSASGLGGGLDNFASTTTLNNATIQNNTADLGGGVYTDQDLTITNSTIARNTANLGGGIYNANVLRLLNSTISQNASIGDGGGILNLGVVEVVSATIFGNRADADGDGIGTGGGIWTGSQPFSSAGDLPRTILFNTIVAGNLRGMGSAVNDLAGRNVDPTSTNNLISDPSSAGGLIHDPTDANGDDIQNIVGNGQGNLLDPSTFMDTILRDNGGPTLTHALLPGGIAVNSGALIDPPVIESGPAVRPEVKQGRGVKEPPPVPMAPDIMPGVEMETEQTAELEIPLFDQRGPFFFRITGGAIDIGAFEVQFEIHTAVGSGGGIEAGVAVFTAAFPARPIGVLRPYTVDLDPNSELDAPLRFMGAVRVALADVNGDGFNDIITAAGPGGGPHIRVFDGRTFQPIDTPVTNFMAYDPRFLGGVFVAAADFDGDGRAEIVTGADAGGGPHVRVFSPAISTIAFDFFAYNAGFLGGVRVAAGDVNGDGTPEIITGAGTGGGPHVRVFDGTKPADAAAGIGIDSFFAFRADYTGGIFVAVNNSAGPRMSPIVVASGTAFHTGARVALFQRSTELAFFELPTSAGARVAVLDINQDGVNDYLLGTGPGASGLVQLIDGNPGNPPIPPFDNGEPFGPTIANFFPIGNLYLEGVFVAASL